jgi:di/tricarboxylate transporter
MDEVYASMEWNALFLIAGLYPASQAVVNTGAAALIGQQVVQWVAPLGGLGLAGGAYLLSAALTQIMGGQVTAFVTAPITISAAIALGVNPQAIAIATAMGCSASFITPISHPVNILVVGAGGYTLRDFVRVGLGLLAVCFVLLLIGMRAFWGL